MKSDNEDEGMAGPTRVYVDEVLPDAPRIVTAAFRRVHAVDRRGRVRPEDLLLAGAFTPGGPRSGQLPTVGQRASDESAVALGHLGRDR